MRIAIIGAQCTGKTTLLEAVKRDGVLKSHVFVSEVVRKLVQKDGILINNQPDFDSQKKIFMAHYGNAISNPRMVTDRSCIDAWAYTCYNRSIKLFTSEQYTQLYYLFESTLITYDKLFYLPIEFPMVSDDFRSTDVKFQYEVDRVFLNIFQLYNLKIIPLTGALDNRLTHFKESLI